MPLYPNNVNACTTRKRTLTPLHRIPFYFFCTRHNKCVFPFCYFPCEFESRNKIFFSSLVREADLCTSCIWERLDWNGPLPCESGQYWGKLGRKVFQSLFLVVCDLHLVSSRTYNPVLPTRPTTTLQQLWFILKMEWALKQLGLRLLITFCLSCFVPDFFRSCSSF